MLTNDDSQVNEQVICKPLPKINLPELISNTPWRKLSVWQFPLADLRGDVLFLDLDLITVQILIDFLHINLENTV